MSFEIEMGTHAMILCALLYFQTTYISEYFTINLKYHSKVKEKNGKDGLNWLKATQKAFTLLQK